MAAKTKRPKWKKKQKAMMKRQNSKVKLTSYQQALVNWMEAEHKLVKKFLKTSQS